MATKEQRKAAPTGKAPHTPLAEWIAAAVSAVLVLGVVGFLIYDAVQSPPTPPNITIEIDSIGPAGPGYLVQFRARNSGGTTAAEVVVEGELVAEPGKTETAETTLDYVPAGGLKRAGLYFNHDPRGGELQLRARGYREP